MKKVFMGILVLLMVLTCVNPALAEAGFSLSQGSLEGNYLDNTLLKTFFNTLRLEAVFSQQQQKYTLSATAQVESPQYEYPDGNDRYAGTDTGNGDVTGEYDPLTGGFYGTVHYEAKFSGKVGTSTLTATVSYVDCEFTAIASPGDTRVVFSFVGKDLNKGKDVSFTGTFAVQGSLPFTQQQTEEPEETEEAQPTPEAVKALPDSGTRFSDLSGQVEFLIPTGYDADGDPVYDEEAWQFAKLDTVLPEGTRIKASDDSSAILSFSDMTTFIMKPETEIILSKPEAGPGTFQLLIGKTWTNLKHVIKTGELPFEGSQAVAGIKGTTFVLEDDGQTTTLKVLEGVVAFTSKATGESVDVSAGEMISATKAGSGDVKTFDIDAEMAGWTAYGAAMPQDGFPLWAILAVAAVVLLGLTIILTAVIRNKKRAASCPPHV